MLQFDVAILTDDLDHHLVHVRLAHSCDSCSTDIKANFSSKGLIVFFFLGGAAVKFDACHDLVFSHLCAAAVLPVEGHLLAIMLQLLVEEDLQLLLRA